MSFKVAAEGPFPSALGPWQIAQALLNKTWPGAACTVRAFASSIQAGAAGKWRGGAWFSGLRQRREKDLTYSVTARNSSSPRTVNMPIAVPLSPPWMV